MNGEQLFEAMSEIDDELIERAQGYRPQKNHGFKLAFGIVAAGFLLVVGVCGMHFIEKMDTDVGNHKSSSTYLQDQEGEKFECFVMDSQMNNAESADTGMEQAEKFYVGELSGCQIFVMGKTKTAPIYVKIQETEYLLEQAPLEENDKEEVVRIVEMYLKKESVVE